MSTVRYLLYREPRMVGSGRLELTGMDFRGRTEGFGGSDRRGCVVRLYKSVAGFVVLLCESMTGAVRDRIIVSKPERVLR